MFLSLVLQKLKKQFHKISGLQEDGQKGLPKMSTPRSLWLEGVWTHFSCSSNKWKTLLLLVFAFLYTWEVIIICYSIVWNISLNCLQAFQFHFHKWHCRSIAAAGLTSSAMGIIRFWSSPRADVREVYSSRISPLARKAKALRIQDCKLNHTNLGKWKDNNPSS